MKLEIILYMIYVMGATGLCGFLQIKELPVMTDSGFGIILNNEYGFSFHVSSSNCEISS